MKGIVSILFLVLFCSQGHATSLYAPNGANPQVVFAGDSLTAGYPYGAGDALADETKTYPYKFKNTNFPGTMSLNNAHNGYGVIEVSGIWAAQVVANSPRYVILMIGVNDIVDGVLTTADYLGYMTNLLNSAAANDMIPVIIRVLPWDVGTNEKMQTLDAWMVGLAALVVTYSPAVWTDCGSAMGQFRVGGDAGNLWDLKPAYSYDGTHLTEAGNTALANCVASALNASAYVIGTPVPLTLSGGELTGGERR